MVWWPTKDIYNDFGQRAPWYIHDWKQGTTVGFRHANLPFTHAPSVPGVIDSSARSGGLSQLLLPTCVV